MALRTVGSRIRRTVRGAALAAVAVSVVALGATVLAGPAAAAGLPAPVAVAGAPDLGPDVYVFTPSMDQSDIQTTLDALAAQQVPNQFGTQRYAVLFEPGTYGTPTDPLVFQVGYYTEVAGLGQDPTDVTINGTVDVYNQCDATDGCIALDNFWRSLSNLTIDVAGGSGCQANTEFWAVSQASPMRRVNVQGASSLMDYCTAGPQYASGGYIADSAFSGNVVNGSQQQFIVRNSALNGWSNGVWNQVFSGVDGAPAEAFGQAGDNQYTTLATSPVTQEEPYLYIDAKGTWQVFVPALQHDSSGTTWSAGHTPGTSRPLSSFFLATPKISPAAINLALLRGRNLLLEPGVYDLSSTIVVDHPNTIVLGLGFPTLVPQTGKPALQVATPSGVKLSGMIFDAGPRTSPALLQLGVGNRLLGRLPIANASAAAPTLVQDVFFRVGGATAGRTSAALVDYSSHAILDDIWAWRADHGTGVGWTQNTAPTGVIVDGNDVTAYGLFVEHFQKTEVQWNGQGGEDIFFQNEMPYDVPSQAAWMSSPTVQGYPAIALGSGVRTFQGYGLGSYSFFNQGIDIHATQAFDVPQTPGVQLHDLLTVFLNGSGGIDSVVDGTGAPVSSATSGTPSNVVSFP